MRLADFIRPEPEMRRRFFELAAPHVWPRILRTLEHELSRPAKGRRGSER